MSFPDTHVSIVRRTASPDAEVRTRAVETLAAVYWRPVYVHIRLSHALAREDAEDLTQGFFAEAVRRELFARYDPDRARFRTFLRQCVDSFAANEHKAAQRQKRGGGARHVPIDVTDLEPRLTAGADVDRLFHDEWVRCVFATSLGLLREQYAASDRRPAYEMFERYDVLGAALPQRPTYAELAADLGVPTTTATNWLSAARRDFRAAVLETLRDMTGSDAEYREEAASLLGVTEP